MIKIDGSQGEGGGQILRSALALSLVTCQPVTIDNIRARRNKPGLMRQHLAAVRAAQLISQAEVVGDQLGSQKLVVHPSATLPGEYRFDVGSAGSTTLVFQTILPALMLAETTSQVELLGGTHNPAAPPFEFLTHAFVPQLHKVGVTVRCELFTPGFYPAGGGRCVYRVSPSKQLCSVELCERGELVDRRVRAVVSNLPMHIAERECRTIARQTGWPPRCFSSELAGDSPGPGNVVMIELEYERVTEVFMACGRIGKTAEQVAKEALAAAQAYQDAAVPVGIHLADQLMLPLGLAAHFGQPCAFRTLPLTPHATTHIKVLERFLDVSVTVEQSADSCLVRLGHVG